MLFCYPIEATFENWLHDGLMELLTRIFNGTDDPLNNWLGAFPAEKRDEVEKKPSLLEALRAVAGEIVGVPEAGQAGFLACMQAQNHIPDIFDPGVALVEMPDGYDALVERIETLFRIAFRMLTPLGIRDRQYALIYEHMPAHVCAFCGIEPLTAPDPAIPRESLDHYLPFSRYPFAAVNLRNLAPTGTKCNGPHKHNVDTLRDIDSVRRRCFDPFGGATATVSLLNSRPLEGATVKAFRLPHWQIDLEGNADAVATWDAVYDIKTRYQLNILDKELRNWLDHFANWVARDAAPPTTRDEVVALINRYLNVVIQEGFADFLKREVFGMLAHRCRVEPSAGRVTAWLIALLSPETGAAIVDQAA
ncbi:hypothetical protein NKI80_02600 [Mesorhizobium sp. M0387]|uniref:hypothetical protein n=1 Tax=Mesorhizobium sp. M0387 TaxID=2956940 RepID=UPI0033392989